MPVIAIYKGITSKMYFQQEEHNPPHVHASCGERASIIFLDPNMPPQGNLTNQQLRNAKEWVYSNKAALLAMWNTQDFHRIQ